MAIFNLVLVLQTNLKIKHSFSFLDGVADAASQTASLSILIALYPTKAATVLSYFQSLFGLGYMFGKYQTRMGGGR